MLIKLFASVLLIVSISIYAVDFVFFLKDRYCRFHIGRWQPEAWRNAVERVARKWVKRTPTVKITDNSRYILIDCLRGKYRSHSIQSWQKAALILGLWESSSDESKAIAKNAALDLIDEKGSWRKAPIDVDCGMLAYAVLKIADDPETVRPAMDYARQLIEKNINSEGMISYTGGKDNPEMYVDTIGLTCAFLALYAKVYGVPECEKIAFHQLYMYHEHGLMKGTALPNHAFHICSKLPLGVFGWGRGIAWYTIGLTDTYHELQTAQYKEMVHGWILEAAEAYLPYQHADGGFGAIVQREGTYDSSATAALAWFFGQCYAILERQEYQSAAQKCLGKLLKKTRITGAIDECQGDTKGIGIFAQTYDIMPFAQGMTLRAMNLRLEKE